MALTPKQQRFVDEYCVDLNATKAAIRAGYSKESAAQQGHAMLRKHEIAAAVDAELQNSAKRVHITQDHVLQELVRLALVDIGDAYDDEGAPLELKDMPEDVRRAISSLEVEELKLDDAVIGRVKKLKLLDKKGALELLGRHLKMWTDKLEHSGGLTLEQLVAAGAVKKPEEPAK